MTELASARLWRRKSDWRLMAGVSVATLLAVAALTDACAEDASRPTVWVQFGGQLERVDGGQERFTPPFISVVDTQVFTSPLAVQTPPRYATGFEGNVSIQPDESKWIFSAAIRYGRSNGSKKVHQLAQSEPAHLVVSLPAIDYQYSKTVTAYAHRYSDTTVKNNESHTVLDFQAGRDVGLGLFGGGGTSIVSAGIRFAQFASRSQVSIGGDPDFSFSYKYATHYGPFTGYFKVPYQHWHLNRSQAEIERNFHGIGPSIAWQGSIPVIGRPDQAELLFDWGANAAVLFGRQKAMAQHGTDGSYHYQPRLGAKATVTLPHLTYATARTRSVTVPNVGGFAGLSLKFSHAEVKLGYRADVFFGAIDGGIDARKTYDRAFYGPFAKVSIGLGG